MYLREPIAQLDSAGFSSYVPTLAHEPKENRGDAILLTASENGENPYCSLAMHAQRKAHTHTCTHIHIQTHYPQTLIITLNPTIGARMFWLVCVLLETFWSALPPRMPVLQIRLFFLVLFIRMKLPYGKAKKRWHE